MENPGRVVTMDERRAVWASGITILVVTMLWMAVGIGQSKGQDGHHHPPQDADAHEQFYQHLTRPDIPDAPPGSCCSGYDCYSTPARYQNGRWMALRREDRTWIEIPESKIVVREDQLARRPDMTATLCATPYTLYCFVEPQSGI